jgi:hypothetical protein
MASEVKGDGQYLIRKAGVRVQLFGGVQKVFARVKAVVEVRQATLLAREIDDGVNRLQKCGGATGFEDDFERIHKHRTFAEERERCIQQQSQSERKQQK